MKKLIHLFTFFVSFIVILFTSNTVHAQKNTIPHISIEFQNLIEKNTVIQNNTLVLTNQDTIYEFIEKNIDQLNKNISPKEFWNLLTQRVDTLNNLKNTPGYYINKQNGVQQFQTRGNYSVTSYHLWGVRHEYLNDWAVKQDAHEYLNISNIIKAGSLASNGLSRLIVAFFPKAWIGSLSMGAIAWYSNNIGINLLRVADMPGNGAFLDINYWLTYRCYPR